MVSSGIILLGVQHKTRPWQQNSLRITQSLCTYSTEIIETKEHT